MVRKGKAGTAKDNQNLSPSCDPNGAGSAISGGVSKETVAQESRLFRLRAFPKTDMSQHRSLKGASTIAAKRNVLKRFERVELLKKRGLFKAGDKVIGLRKTKPDA
jgi:small basic protein (TIGR04137 family)